MVVFFLLEFPGSCCSDGQDLIRRPSFRKKEPAPEYEHPPTWDHYLAPGLDARCWLAVVAAQEKEVQGWGGGSRARVGSGEVNSRRGPAICTSSS